METAIENVVVKNNPRIDFGDIDELTASVKDKGILEPLLVKKLDGDKVELIAGERRLRSARASGLNKVPIAFYEGDKTDIEEVKLIENIHRKDLNPVEEASAFKKYMDVTKSNLETLAKRLSKPKLYIERRLQIVDLPEQVHKALQDGKILLGHGLILSRLDPAKEQVKILKKIIQEKMSVSDTENHMRCEDSTTRLENAEFDKSDCKGCKQNGGEQAVLFDSGAELKGLCLNKKCFMKKTNQWKQEQTRELQKQGIKVFSPANLNDIKIKERVCSYEDDYKKILKKLPKEPENYAVSFEDNYSGMPEKCIYCLNPKVRRPKQTVEQDEKAKNQNTMNKLQNKIAIFKREFLIRKSQELMQPGTKKTKAISLFALLQEGISWNDRARRETTEKLLKDEKIGKASFGSIEPNFSKILAMDEKNIDRIISYVSGLWIKQMGNHLTKAAETLGVNLTEHFIINEEYLKPYTKQALLKLATEIGLDKHLKQKGIDNWGKSKRPDMVNYFLNEGFDLKGKVPKLIQ